MIVLMVLFNVAMPVNVYSILIEIMKLTNLDVIDTNWLLDKLINLTYLPTFSFRFEEAGYDTTNFLIELGPLLFLILASLIGVLIKLALKWCIERRGD